MTQDDQTIRFRCPSCSATMRARAAEAGEARKCPKCKTTFRIPHGRGAGKTKAAKPKPKKKEQPLVPVVCGVCNTRVYANLNQVGSKVECPDCYTQNLVKPPEKKAVKAGLDLGKIGEYDLAPAQEIEVVQTMGEDMLEEADELVQQEIDAAPQMPDRPFLQGVFTYPFRLSVMPTLIGMAMAWSFFAIVLDGAWGLEGFASAVAPFILGGAAFFFTLVVIPSFVTFQNIMENGANGDDESEIRPDGGFFAMVEWVVDVLPIVMAATISCVPTLGLLRVLETLTGGASRTSWAFELIAVYAAYSLFSLIFLSMLENNSIIGIYSAQVWKSVATQTGSWFKFWSLTTLLFGALAAIVLGCLELREMPFNGTLIGGTILAMSLLTCVLAIYFRLLGRLAFVLTSQPPARSKRSARKDREEQENLEISTTGV